MKKRIYIAPKTDRQEMEAAAQVMAGTVQPPYADAKRRTTFDDAEDYWQEDDDPWESVAKHKDDWE